ncbi:MAG: Crp/Fnr family transcriptional regulator [Pseudomonadota bacterium]
MRHACNGKKEIIMDVADLSPFLRDGSLLADLPGACLERLAPLGQNKRFAKGQTVFQKGDPGDFLAVILGGRLKISTFSVAGAETVLNLLQSGDVVGEIAAIDGLERTADAIVNEDTELLIFPRATLLRLMADDAEFSASLAKALALKLRAASDALEATTLDMSRRVAAAFLRLVEQNALEASEETGDYTLAIDQTTLARYAGLTRSNLNRVLKRFERAGASRHEKGVLEILDLDWLQDFAESED